MAGQSDGIVHLRAVGFIGMVMDGETKLLANSDGFVGTAGVDDDTFIGNLQQRRQHLHQQARFNDRPVDDQVVGHASSVRLQGFVRHDTFYSLHEVFNKLNSYTTRLVKHQQIKPSLARGIVSAIGAFFKWYLFSGAWRYGKVGVVTGLYATFYSFLKYFKAWYAHEDNQAPVAQKRTDP